MVPALLLACAYAAFARGAVDDPGEARLQVGLALIALWAAGAWLMTGPPPAVRLRAAPAGWWGLGLLAAFAAFTAVTLFWSVAPGGTWIEVNRVLAYTLVVALAIAAGTSSPRAV